MNKSKDNQKPANCLNCHHPLDEKDNYCPECGQKALPERLTTKYFIHEFLNNYFSFDSKFFSTIKPLVVKPAFLSLEFIEGRRIRYINPVQLFIFISFIYFLVDSFMFLKEPSEKRDYVTFKEDGKKVDLDSLDFEQYTKSNMNDSTGTLSEGSLVEKFINKAQKFGALDKDEQNERISKFISYFIFLLTPLFALLLGWFFPRRYRYYLDNLIFSLHFHAAFFLIGIFFMLIDRLVPNPIDSIIMNLTILTYLFLALRHFFGYKILTTIFRLLGLMIIYVISVFVCFLSSIIISIYL